MTQGATIKNIVPLPNPAPFRIRRIPDPNIPAKPVPDPKKPTTVLGNPLQNPRVVDSPRALPTPNKMEERRAIKKDALLVLKVDAKAMIMKADRMMIEFTKRRCMCSIFIKYLALHSLVTLLKTIRHLYK